MGEGKGEDRVERGERRKRRRRGRMKEWYRIGSTGSRSSMF